MNDINGIGEGIGIIGLMAFYIWFKVWMYKREYKGDRDIVIKRGAEWDFEHKKNENKKDI
jgi:hypothetical protein